MKEESERLLSSNKTLQERFAALQADSSNLIKERNQLKNELEQLRRMNASGSKASRQSEESQSKEVEDLRDRLHSLE